MLNNRSQQVAGKEDSEVSTIEATMPGEDEIYILNNDVSNEQSITIIKHLFG